MIERAQEKNYETERRCCNASVTTAVLKESLQCSPVYSERVPRKINK